MEREFSRPGALGFSDPAVTSIREPFPGDQICQGADETEKKHCRNVQDRPDDSMDIHDKIA